VNAKNDRELLQAYALENSEAAFAELVRRYVHLVYSAALRLVVDPHLAEDVTQGAFIALAQNAPKLSTRRVLSSWLHVTARNLAAKQVRSEERRRARENEVVAMETGSPEAEPIWRRVAPHLDEAIGFLSDNDRSALMLRYFEQKSAREIAQVLDLSEDAAQKRVTRALERLRELLAKRGVTVGASVLVALISANAVHAAPAGLVVTISSALAGTTIATSATATAAKAITMTTIQKMLVAAIVVAAATTSLVVKHREVVRLRKEVVALRRENESLLGRPKSERAPTVQPAASAELPKVEASAPSYSAPAEVVAKIAALLSERKPLDKTRMEALAMLISQIKPDQFDQALQAALQLPDPELRTAISQTLFRNWIETNPRAALAFATVHFQGQEKSDGIRDALQRWAAQDPDGAFGAWRDQAEDSTGRLAWGGDQRESVAALFEGISQQNLQKASQHFLELRPDCRAGALQGMARAAARTEQGRKFFLVQLDLVTDSALNYEATSDFMFNWSQNDLPSATAWIEKQPPGKQRDYALRQAGLNYVRRDPKAGADWWLAQTTPAERSQALFGIAQTWASVDINGAGEWLNRLDLPEMDSGRAAFADVAVAHEPETALKWAESIKQPSYRNEVLVRTWQKWHRANSGAAEQFLARCGWQPELVAQARGDVPSR
jgi:RNA polymerase sigma factor (sigma-70 family)